MPSRRLPTNIRLCPAGSWVPTALAGVACLLGSDAVAAPTPAGGLTNPLRPAQDCFMCHSPANADVHAADPLYAPYFGWQGGLMANAARDPIFWAGVAIADQDHPGETTDCIRCHAPRAFLNNRGGATAITDLLPEDFDGVTCEACHRMTDDSPNPLGNARYHIDDVLVGGNVPRRGPWNDYVEPYVPPHSFIADPFTGSSELCGTCHDVSTARPRVDDDGTQIAPAFNEQRTYSEWANSDFAVDGEGFASCVDCHMPAVADMAACADFTNVTAHPEGGRRHDLVGANRFMLALLQQEYGSAGSGDVSDFYFDIAIERVDELLATAATIAIEGPASVEIGSGLDDLAVTVTNTSGHKLPTGYSEGRVMWIELEASYNDAVVWHSGALQDIVESTDDAQLRTYQGLAEERSTGTSLHLLLNDHWVQDTRIPPLGLTPDIETDPVGDRYALQGDGTWPNFDVAPYAFAGAPDVADATPDDPDDDALTVTARLWYLINTPAYVQFLADTNATNEAGSEVAALFEGAGGTPPILLAESALAIPITGFGAVPGSTDTGAADSTGAVADTTATTGARPPTDDGADPSGPADSTGGATDTDGPGQDDDSSGCACTASPRPGDAAWWLLLPALGVTRRRRAPAQPAGASR